MAEADASHGLCDRCLGRRLVGAKGTEPQRGAARARRTWPEVAEPACPVCEGAFADAPTWLRLALEATSGHEFSTFQIGTQFPSDCEARERMISASLGQEKVGETIRTEANRWLAAEITKATGATLVAEGRPDLVITFDTRLWHAAVEANSVYVYGRYTKLRRDIPQTHWPCRRCQGTGCWQCNDTGVTYTESVEDAIGIPAETPFEATGHAFHGAGREDIDALMLGTGRPFIVELKEPHKRKADLAALSQAINVKTSATGVGVQDLRLAAPEEVAALKAAEHDKEYLAHCVSETPLARADVERVCASLTGTMLEQRTPDRVSHRRADLVRRRKVHRVLVEAMLEDPSPRFSIRVLAASGTYIKEMVSGDEGRTTPSFSALAGGPVKVEFLDVLAILDIGASV